MQKLYGLQSNKINLNQACSDICLDLYIANIVYLLSVSFQLYVFMEINFPDLRKKNKRK